MLCYAFIYHDLETSSPYCFPPELSPLQNIFCGQRHFVCRIRIPYLHLCLRCWPDIQTTYTFNVTDSSSHAINLSLLFFHQVFSLHSTTTGFPVKRNAPTRSRNSKHLTPSRSLPFTPRQPPGAPNTLLTLSMRSNTRPRLHIPNFTLPIKSTAQQVFARAVEIKRHDPSIVAR
jgi:hypothetical protein